MLFFQTDSKTGLKIEIKSAVYSYYAPLKFPTSMDFPPQPLNNSKIPANSKANTNKLCKQK